MIYFSASQAFKFEIRRFPKLLSHSRHFYLSCYRKGSTVESENWKSGKKSYALQLVEKSPEKVQPYLKLMRIHQPIGTWLLFWPCGWSICLASPPASFPDPFLLFIFGIGSFVMRGAGCTINDMWDKHLDKKVERTSSRPLANNDVTMKNAVYFLAAQLSIGWCILCQLNWYSIALGSSSLALVALYPLVKRYSFWPQLVLGLTFNWGALLGWSAVQGSCSLEVIPIYIAGICWTLIYDTIYAHQDIKDDLIIGIKSTAIKFGENTKPWLYGFSSIMIANLLAGGVMLDQTWPYYCGVIGASVHILNQIYTLNIHKVEDCGNKFRSNRYVGLILFLGCMFGTYIK